MAEVVQGVIRGKTIDLKANPGIAEGATVEVTIRPVAVRRVAGVECHGWSSTRAARPRNTG
jgi:hypothetical protein